MSEWISVEDRLPDEIGQYFAYATYDGMSVMEWRTPELNDDLQWWDGYGNPTSTTVTHWMPLPGPPK